MSRHRESPRMTPEQFLAKRAEDKADNAQRQRISIASRSYAITVSQFRPLSIDELKRLANEALRAADVLIEEAGKS